MSGASKRSSKRPSQRLGIGGEMVPPGPNLLAQGLFLEAVWRCVPEALVALATIAPSLPDDYFNQGNKDQEQPLREWCEHWGFTTDWLLTVARRTATRMRHEPDASGKLEWVFGPSYGKLKTETVAPLHWNPSEETEAQFRGRVDAYIAAVKGVAEALDWTDAPEKRMLEHFDWLARYQVEGWTQAKINERYQDEKGRPDVPAVSRALTSTAKLIGLQLRPAQGRDREP